MKIRDILCEAMRYQEIPQEQLPGYCAKNHSEFFQKFHAPAVFRGSRYSHIPSGTGRWVNPSAQERVSRNTSNEYTVLLSNLPAWKSYPPRNRSIICTNNPEIAGVYGDAFAVILPRQFNMGMAPQGDLWHSFEHLRRQTKVDDLRQFNEDLRTLAGRTSSTVIDHPTFEHLQQQFRLIQEWLMNLTDPTDQVPTHLGQFLHRQLHAQEAPGEDEVMRLIADLLDPNHNRFRRLTSYTDLAQLMESRSREVWTDSPVLLIPQADYHALREQVLSLLGPPE